jgi:hypothetical protein
MKNAHLEQNLLVFLKDLPPVGYWLYCLTEDQKDHWWMLKNNYKALYQSFQEYFTGQPESQYYQFDKNDREFYSLFRDWYLAFYDLIQWNWTEIDNTFRSRGQNLEGFASSPGEALIQVMENDCYMFFLECVLPYHRWTPYKARDLRKIDFEIEKAKNLIKGKSDPKLERKIKTYQNNLDSLLPSAHYYRAMAFRECCIDVCERIKNPTNKRYLTDYKRVKSELDAKIHYFLHPDKKLRGHEWRNGVKRSMDSHGGRPLNISSQ